MLLCRCCYYCVHLLCQICHWSTSRSRCIHSSSFLFVVYMKAKCRCSVGRTADVLHLCSCSHAVDMHWMYGPHLNTQDSPSTTASVLLLLSLNTEPSSTLCTRWIPALLSPPDRTGITARPAVVTCSGGPGQIHSDERREGNTGRVVRISFLTVGHAPEKMSHRQPWN